MKKTFLLCLTLILAACSNRAPETAQRDSRLIRRPAQPTLQDRLEARGFRFGAPAFIRIFKKEEVLEVWLQKDNGEYALFLDYPICIYSGELGPKTREGDKQSPEGFYAVGSDALNPNSQYHLSFNLGYPNAYDRAHGYSGSLLMVHGKCVSIGCYAMGDRQIEEIYTLVGAALQRGQPFVRVHAFPFRMTDSKLAAYSDHRWYDFWKMLKPGYDYFEKYHQPPEIDVIGGQYALSDRNPHPAVRPGELPPGHSTPIIPGENLNTNPLTGGMLAQNSGSNLPALTSVPPSANTLAPARAGTNALLANTPTLTANNSTLPALTSVPPSSTRFDANPLPNHAPALTANNNTLPALTSVPPSGTRFDASPLPNHAPALTANGGNSALPVPAALPSGSNEAMPVLRGSTQPPLGLTSYGASPTPVN